MLAEFWIVEMWFVCVFEFLCSKFIIRAVFIYVYFVHYLYIFVCFFWLIVHSVSTLFYVYIVAYRIALLLFINFSLICTFILHQPIA